MKPPLPTQASQAKPIVWVIAGSDSSRGAGLQSDLLTFNDFHLHACTITTLITAQNTHSLDSVSYCSAKNIADQINSLDTDLPPCAIKLSAIGSAEAVKPIACYLKQYKGPVVFDPILQATAGPSLLEPTAIPLLKKNIFPYVDFLTPNLREAEVLLNTSIDTADEMEAAAHRLLQFGIKGVCIKGGHLENTPVARDYFTDGTHSFWMNSPKIIGKQVHGTGCVFSAALTAATALGYEKHDALVIAKMYLNQSIRHSRALGRGHFLIQHAGWPQQQRDLPYVTLCATEDQYPASPPCFITESPQFYPIVDSLAWAEKMLSAGVKTLQLRIKHPKKQLVEQAVSETVRLARQYKAQLFINDDWQLALRYGAYGVHLGQEDLLTADLPAIKTAGLRLGISTHSFYEVASAHRFQPSYLAYGPVYFTHSKPMKFEPQGLERLGYWKNTLDYPLVAIGGISLSRAKEISALEVNGIAVISAIKGAEDPLQAARDFLELLTPPDPVCSTPSCASPTTHLDCKREETQRKGYAARAALSSNSTAEPALTLSPEEAMRYQQQMRLSEIGNKGQIQLKKARVLCIGAGGLGSPLCVYLAAAGIGTLGIVDGDSVSLSNLHRQILFRSTECGVQKTIAAQHHLNSLNPHCHVETYPFFLSEENVLELISQYDLIADCSDNFATKYLINDACYELKKPYLLASIQQFKGYCSFFSGTEGPCYRCLFPSPPQQAVPNCSQTGILPSVSGLLGLWQANEILKFILTVGEPLIGKVLRVDALKGTAQPLTLSTSSECLICAKKTPFNQLPRPLSLSNLTLHALSLTEAQRLQTQQPSLLIDVRKKEECQEVLPNSINLPLNELPAHLNDLIQSKKNLILYCQSDRRSRIACQLFLEKKYENVFFILGGIAAYSSNKEQTDKKTPNRI